MAKNYFKRYIWLVDLINRRGPISFRDISDAWSGRGGAGTSRITEKNFRRCRRNGRTLWDLPCQMKACSLH